MPWVDLVDEGPAVRNFLLAHRVGRGDYTHAPMALSPPLLPDAVLSAGLRRRSDRLRGFRFSKLPHPVLVHGFMAARDRVSDMRLPDGPALISSVYQNVMPESGDVPLALGRHPLIWADIAPQLAGTGHSTEVLGPSRISPAWWLALQQLFGRRAPAGPERGIVPMASGRFESVADASQSLVIDLFGITAGWPLQARLAEMARLLAPGGAYVLVGLGPTSLAAFWSAWGRPLPASPWWYDLHDLGDALGGAGLAAPVAESERLRLTYTAAERAWADIRDFPVRPASGPGAGALLGRQSRAGLFSALEACRGQDGRIALGVELVIVHAWKPEQSAVKPDAVGPKPISWHPRSPSKDA